MRSQQCDACTAKTKLSTKLVINESIVFPFLLFKDRMLVLAVFSKAVVFHIHLFYCRKMLYFFIVMLILSVTRYEFMLLHHFEEIINATV